MFLWESGRQLCLNMLSSPAIRYHGLINQGATCYLNSVLQVLFMTEDFREAVKKHNSDPERIDLQLTSLFDELQKYAAYTYKITKKLGIDNVYEQRDAAEYFEKILALTSHEPSRIFHGQQTQKTICSTCSTKTDSDGAFWNLTLALVNSSTGDYSVADGIEEYFRDSNFSGENQMYCDVCDAKSDATIKCKITDHPEVLMLLLKRFAFDYRYMTYVKINCSVAVPCTLQIPENQTYELYAVVNHFGDLRSGHYTATIKPLDSERWHQFNDDSVTLLDYQPFQVDNFVKSNSAYLLFYRKKKVHAADTCTQDTGEMSSPGGLPPPTSDIYNDQFTAEVKRKESETVEWAAEAEQTIDRNEKPGIKDRVVVGSSGVGLSSDLYKEDQDNRVYSRQRNHQDCDKDRNDLSYRAEQLRDKDQIMTDDEEDKRGNAQAENQTVRRGSLSGETQLEESVDDPNDDSIRTGGVRHRTPQEGLEGEDMHNTEQKQEVSNMHPQQVCVDMQKDVENMAMDVNRDKGGRRGMQEGMETDDEERKPERRKLLTIQDLNNDGIQGNGVGKSKQNMPKDDPRFKRRIESRFYQSHEQPREKEMVGKGDKQQKRGDDEHAQRRGASERQEQDQNRRSERVTTQKDVPEAKRARGGNEHIQTGADSSLRHAGSAGSSRVTENRGDGSVEESQPSKARTGLNEDTMEGKRSSKQSKTYQGKIIEEETQGGVQKTISTKNIRIKTVEGGSRVSLKSLVEYDDGNAEIQSDPKTLTQSVHNLHLNDSPLLKPQKRRKEKNETKSTSHSNARKMQNVSDAQALAVGKKHAVKERGEKKRKLSRWLSPLKQNRKGKKKCKSIAGCFPFLRKSRKTADTTSESD